jgi:acetoin utilization protein AcuC
VSGPAALPQDRPLYIGSEIYRFSTYGPTHPLAVPRVSTCTDLIRAMGWLDERQFVTAPMARVEQITRFHDPAYVAALQRAERHQSVDEADRRQFRIGTDGNPVFPEIFSRPATSAGGVMLGARLALAGRAVHCPGGGTHHGRRDRASGFCYLNDPVLGLLTWLDAGLDRVAYLDIDAHHGDGVQDAFADDDRVLTVSIHEAGRWPGSGHVQDRAGGMARNLPVPPGFNDSEMRWLMQRAVLPLLRQFRPQAIMLQTGADALEEDPLARLALSNNAYFEVARAVRAWGGPLLVVGGGGYNPYSTGRCWAGIWATLNDQPIPPRTTAAAERVLRALTYNRAAGRNPPAHWFTTIRDAPREGPVSDPVRRVADQTLEMPHDHPPPAAGQPAAGARDRARHGASAADRAAARTAEAEAGDRHA